MSSRPPAKKPATPGFTIVSDQLLFYSWLGAILILIGTSTSRGSKEWNRNDYYMGTFLTALGLFVFAFSIWAYGCQECVNDDCVRPTFRLMDFLAFLGAFFVFLSSLMILRTSAENSTNVLPTTTTRPMGYIVLFVMGWILVSLSIAARKKIDAKRIFFIALGGSMTIAGELFLIGQRKEKIVEGPGLILSSVGLLMLGLSNSLIELS